MPILMVILSDIHLSSDKDPILRRVASIKDVLREKLDESNNDVLIVISGDITFSGKASEFELAKRLFSDLEKEIRSVKQSIDFKYIVVPGNHDTNFEMHTQTREQLIQDVMRDQQLLKKPGILFDCLVPQKCYHEWCSSIVFQGINNDNEKFVFERIFGFPDSTRIKFLGYNTSWMVLPDKGHGDILFPMELIAQSETDENADLVFSVLHHPNNWMRSEFSASFREKVEFTSNIIITGHEHNASYQSTTHLFSEVKQYIPSGELQNITNKDKSTFNTILIDIPVRKIKYARHSWRDTLYSSEESEWIDIPRSRTLKQDKFILKKTHLDFLLAPGVPFSHSRKSNLTIDDIFVPPDLEELTIKAEAIVIPSNKALDYLLTTKRVLLFGPESSGKTSLLKVMFRKYQQNDIVPLWIDGKDINTGNTNKLKSILSATFESEYDSYYLEDFWQREPAKKAIIIDNLQDTTLNRAAKLSLFDFIHRHFDIALIASSNPISIQEVSETEKNDFLLACKRLFLTEFGSSSRAKLIEKWLLLGQESTIQEPELARRTKEIEEKSRVILRPSLAPSYPFYILTVAQSVDNMGTTIPSLSNEDRGSFGFFYDWLITTALHRSPKKIPDVAAKYRYLSELSHHMYQEHKTKIESGEFSAFHISYLQRMALRYIDLPYEDMSKDLISSGLLIEENGYFEFKYPCVNYYFIARALNGRLQQPQYEMYVKDLVSRLTNQIEVEENENILLFLSYLSENPYIRDTLLQAAKQIFANNVPADLEKDVAFINNEGFNLSLKLPDLEPRQMREIVHEQEDQEQRKIGARVTAISKVEAVTSEEQIESFILEEQIEERLKIITRAFKLVRVMGQIVKNFASSWEGSDKYPITEQTYLLGLRVLEEILTLYSQSYNEFVQDLKETMKYKIEKEMLRLPAQQRNPPTDSQLEILAKAAAFVQTWLVSFNSIFAIAKNVGTQKLYPTYQEIIERHSSLLSVRLIDVAIKLDCQAQLPLPLMEDLWRDCKKNSLGRAILTHLAFNRMSLYETYSDERQKCCQMLGIKQNDPRLIAATRKIGKV